MTEPQATAATAGSATPPITASVMIIGNEILSGRTTDANLPYLAAELTELGIRLMEVRVVADIEDDIVDDITAAAVAKAFGIALHRHPDALALMEKRYKPGELTPGRLKMTEVPIGAGLVDNP